MGTKMKKGILKPFRYISTIMDGKEAEMQIGFPTDVKHVAHIGWDGPGSTNNNNNNNSNNNSGGAPSWVSWQHCLTLALSKRKMLHICKQSLCMHVFYLIFNNVFLVDMKTIHNS
ncbi:Desiccation-associated protein, partial [Zea mays]